MYEQNLVKTVEPIKHTTMHRLNKGKKWKYGYNKEQDLIVISKTGVVGEIIDIQGLMVGLPPEPKNLSRGADKWVVQDYPKALKGIKSIFD